ncbi:Hypothetical protein RG1141_CH18760 [Neorhizobium galegae bv. officinalis bv. officinalis str. HAMBI 1141]|uniref:DUF6680 domain-containing protein n=1 Tax=Neorhizobium galegae bv. officinalis bv. officinalis str. HAMBI 1141 TaxID=1028801 RepID=A0A068T829_NEOGA|nr:DUF6680 family protein [Neorhizobium galegae]CDN54216.1 Hypothetical protein RG1141_CH18760 [Neorhizobium galegae bv. officinalis bv. officinalis str. HAMBI 1141]
MQEPIFLGMRWIDIINIIAIVVGPILAVVVDRLRQRWSDDNTRRLAVFRSLMRTRRLLLDPEHVGALNLVDLEFYGHQRVMDAFSAYMSHLSAPMPGPDGHVRFFEQREDLLVRLLYQMGKDLGFQYDKHDLAKLAYGPAGWIQEQDIQRQNMGYLNELLAGKRALPITPMQPPAANAFPPAPVPISPNGGERP